MARQTSSTKQRSTAGRESGERGASAVLVGFSLVLLGALVAMGVNLGHMLKVRNELQNAADAAALAGARFMRSNLVDLDNARIAAQSFGQRHRSDILPVTLDLNPGNDPAGDIVLGRWNFATHTFSAYNAVTDPDARRVNAVRVHAARTGDEALPVFLSLFLNRSTTGVGASAVAVGGGPCEGCAFPLVFAECQVVNPNDQSLMCDRHLVFSSDKLDNVGFTMLTPDNPNVPGIKDVLNSPDHCADVEAGDLVGVSNGANLAPLVDSFAKYIGQEVTVPIIETDANDCTKFNQQHTIVGFATFTVTNVIKDGNVKTIEIVFVCHPDEPGDTGAVGGCAQYGTTAPMTRLVQ